MRWMLVTRGSPALCGVVKVDATSVIPSFWPVRRCAWVAGSRVGGRAGSTGGRPAPIRRARRPAAYSSRAGATRRDLHLAALTTKPASTGGAPDEGAAGADRRWSRSGRQPLQPSSPRRLHPALEIVALAVAVVLAGRTVSPVCVSASAWSATLCASFSENRGFTAPRPTWSEIDGVAAASGSRRRRRRDRCPCPALPPGTTCSALTASDGSFGGLRSPLSSRATTSVVASRPTSTHRRRRLVISALTQRTTRPGTVPLRPSTARPRRCPPRGP